MSTSRAFHLKGWSSAVSEVVRSTPFVVCAYNMMKMLKKTA